MPELVTKTEMYEELQRMLCACMKADDDFEDMMASDTLYSVLLEITPSYIARTQNLGEPPKAKAAIRRYERLTPDPEEAREKGWTQELDALCVEEGLAPCHYTEGYDAGYREGYAASETSKEALAADQKAVSR